MSYFPLYFLKIPLKTQKEKKASMGEENDYGEEEKMFLKLMFTAKPKHLAQLGLLPPP